MTEKTDCSSIFETPNSSISYDDQQDEDAVSHLIQIISKLESVISKLLIGRKMLYSVMPDYFFTRASAGPNG